MKLIYSFLVIGLFIHSVSVHAGTTNQAYNELMRESSQKYIQYAYLANKIYHEGESSVGHIGFYFGEKWKLVKYKSEENGFQAGIYRNLETNKYIVAIGGTTANPKEANKIQSLGGSILDIFTDLRLLSNLIPDSQSKSALNFIKDKEVLEYGKRKEVTIDAIVGHSLGGGLAAYVGLYDNTKAITFNPSPIPLTTASLEDFSLNGSVSFPGYHPGREFNYDFKHTDKITNIMSNNDAVSNISFLIENTDKKYFNKTNGYTDWNIVKIVTMGLPKEVRLDYANLGNNLWLPIKTGHSISAMLEKMKEAKEYDDYLRYTSKWHSLIKNVESLRDNKIYVGRSFYKDGKLNINFPNESAMRYYVIRDMRVIYNKNAKILDLTTYRNNDTFIQGLGLQNEVKTDDFTPATQYISYREYMKVANATYKKLFGGAFFVRRYIESKNKSSYKIYNDTLKQYAQDDVKGLYRNIFLLHFLGGIPKRYLQNDSQNISNGFLTHFLYRFFHNVIKYRNLKLGVGK